MTDLQTKRRAPKNGYGFVEKTEYREQIWSLFARHLDAAKAKVALFPSQEGLEIETALNFGFREENISAIEADSGVLSNATWRVKFPNVTVYNCKFSTAAPLLGRLDAINLDFCSSLGEDLFNEAAALENCAFYHDSLVAFTVIGSRGGSAFAAMLARYRPPILDWHARTSAVVDNVLLNVPKRLVAAGQYNSGKTPVHWGCFQVKNPDMALQECSDIYLKHYEIYVDRAYKIRRLGKIVDTLRHVYSCTLRGSSRQRQVDSRLFRAVERYNDALVDFHNDFSDAKRKAHSEQPVIIHDQQANWRHPEALQKMPPVVAEVLTMRRKRHR